MKALPQITHPPQPPVAALAIADIDVEHLAARKIAKRFAPPHQRCSGRRPPRWHWRGAAINVHEMVGKSNNNKLLDLGLPISALYQLAAPSTPEVAREEVVRRVSGGEKMTVRGVAHLITTAKTTALPPSSRQISTTTVIATQAVAPVTRTPHIAGVRRESASTICQILDATALEERARVLDAKLTAVERRRAILREALSAISEPSAEAESDDL